ncbi:MAG: HU family DNA-binding protein [Acidiphilium sp.]|nr:HU family DNA-binding protein [Acidiphilium sp.]
MTKAVLAAVMMNAADISGVAAARAANDVMAAIVEELKTKGRFTLPGFGTFTVRTTKARKGINPRTTAPIKIKAGKTVRFKPSPTLKGII